MGMLHKSLAMLMVGFSAINASATAEDSVPGSEIPTNISIEVISIAAPGAMAVTMGAASRQLKTNAQEITSKRSDIVMTTSGQHIQMNFAEQALQGARYGDVVSIEYVPGTVTELRFAVEELDHSRETWLKRIEVTSADFQKAYRRHESAHRALVTKRNHGASEREIKMQEAVIAKYKKEMEVSRQIARDANIRFHSIRAHLQAAKKNLEVAEKSGIVQGVKIKNDILIDKHAPLRLQEFVHRLTASTTSPKRAIPKIHVSRVNMPNLEGAAKLLKQARKGMYASGLWFALAVEEVAIGGLAESLSSDVVEHAPAARNSQNAAVAR